MCLYVCVVCVGGQKALAWPATASEEARWHNEAGKQAAVTPLVWRTHTDSAPLSLHAYPLGFGSVSQWGSKKKIPLRRLSSREIYASSQSREKNQVRCENVIIFICCILKGAPRDKEAHRDRRCKTEYRGLSRTRNFQRERRDWRKQPRVTFIRQVCQRPTTSPKTHARTCTDTHVWYRDKDTIKHIYLSAM